MSTGWTRGLSLLVGNGLGGLLAVVVDDQRDALSGAGPVAEVELGQVPAAGAIESWLKTCTPCGLDRVILRFTFDAAADGQPSTRSPRQSKIRRVRLHDHHLSTEAASQSPDPGGVGFYGDHAGSDLELRRRYRALPRPYIEYQMPRLDAAISDDSLGPIGVEFVPPPPPRRRSTDAYRQAHGHDCGVQQCPTPAAKQRFSIPRGLSIILHG